MKSLVLTFHLLCGADAGTTSYMLTHGSHELFYPTQNPVAASAMIEGQCVALERGATHLYNRRDVVAPDVVRTHETRAKALLITAIAFRGAAVGWNVYQIERHR